MIWRLWASHHFLKGDRQGTGMELGSLEISGLDGPALPIPLHMEKSSIKTQLCKVTFSFKNEAKILS